MFHTRYVNDLFYLIYSKTVFLLMIVAQQKFFWYLLPDISDSAWVGQTPKNPIQKGSKIVAYHFWPLLVILLLCPCKNPCSDQPTQLPTQSFSWHNIWMVPFGKAVNYVISIWGLWIFSINVKFHIFTWDRHWAIRMCFFS